MRFLLLPWRFPIDGEGSYLTTELADALLDRGHEVQALHLDWDAESGGPTRRLTSERGMPVVRVCPRAIGRKGTILHGASKFVLSALHVGREARRRLSMSDFDAIIAWMPSVAFAPVVLDAARAKVASRMLFIWDFFPDHHAEIGRVPAGPVRWVARKCEEKLLRSFTTIFCTLAANGDYLRSRFRLRDGQQVRIAPIWTRLDPPRSVDRERIRSRHGLPQHVPIAVFGGQLAAGRGFDLMLEAAECARMSGLPMLFLFVGDGPLARWLESEAAAAANVRYMPAMPQPEFQQLLGACDVGLVATVAGVSSYSMPSKTLAYFKAGLPVLAAVEAGSDFSALIERRRIGRAVSFSDPASFSRSALFLATDPSFRAGLGKRIYSCLMEVFDVKLAASAVIDAAARARGSSKYARKIALNPAWMKK